MHQKTTISPLHISLIITILFQFYPSHAKPRIKVGYYWYEQDNNIEISNINSSLYTHLIYGFPSLNTTSNQLYISPSDQKHISQFTKKINPSITTLLAIGSVNGTYQNLSTILKNPNSRKSLANSSVRLARLYNFKGLDIRWTNYDIMDKFIIDLRAAVLSESIVNKSRLILTSLVNYDPTSYNIKVLQTYLDWIHIMTSEYVNPERSRETGVHSALFNSNWKFNTDGILRDWISGGLSADKLVVCLPFYGFAWRLLDSNKNGIGAPAVGPAVTEDGAMDYKDIKKYVRENRGRVIYSSSYVTNYVAIGKVWIGFDDVASVRTKVSYAKEMGLLGYFVWQVSYDDNWELSRTAAEQLEQPILSHRKYNKTWRLLEIILTTLAVLLLICVATLYYSCMKKKLKFIERESSRKGSRNSSISCGDFSENIPNLVVYSLVEIEDATDKFSIKNKLGQGGYGPVYKGTLKNGLEIAVKKLSKASTQGFEEFKNEVILTAKLQHVNLVKLLGFCIDRDEQMLIYEYLSHKSLDYYLFDPIKRFILDWNKRVDIIDGVCQGLLYLQEYSRFTIIHRDLKASNILLDENMKAKISDFGLARIFSKHDIEANTGRMVGTYGYAPPEYIKQGIYSIKSDVYSFGVLLLQIISGKTISSLYGENENLSLLQYAHELWSNGRGMEFIDPSLNDDSSSSTCCKILRCLQIALLCVQEIANDRPTMLEVSSMLKSENNNQLIIPKKPAFSNEIKQVQPIESTASTKVEFCSVDDQALTEVVAR